MSSMETAETPLDVLSRAATMVQDSSPPDYECARPCGVTKELPSGRWRRDRREKLSAGYTKHRAAQPSAAATDRAVVVDTPLDMTTPRGMPPPYSQCVGSRPPVRTSARPSVITCAPRNPSPPPPGSPPAGRRREQLSDPVIDEHFRRSLGSDYKSLFNDDKTSSITVTGLSVDDHFAKALGDTWAKLQKSESDLPTKRDEKSPTLAAAASVAVDNKGKDKPSTTTTTPATSKSTSLLQQRRGLVTI